MSSKKIKGIFALLAIVVLLAPGISLANSALAAAKDCFACHSVDEKVVGPSYRDVAARYAGKGDAEEMLIKKVLFGGRGTWGSNRMPANKQVSEQEARLLVEWVLSQSKNK